MSMIDHLAQLEAVQLVRRLSDPELAYIFKHILVQESAYNSVLIKRRRELHRQVAHAIEATFADRLEDLAAMLAHHYAEAGDDPLATLKYARMAGDSASRRYAIAEAIQHYDAALAAARAIPDVDGDTLRHLYISRGRAYELSGGYEQALANYAEMADTARSRGDRVLELAALIVQTTARSTPTPSQDLILAQDLSARALELARALDDQAAEAKILWNRSLMGYFMGQPTQAVADGEQAIAIARRLDLREQLAYALHDTARSYAALGQIEQGKAALVEAETLWRELGNKQMLADSLNSAVEIFAMEGDYDQGLVLMDESARLSRETGNHWGLAYTAMLKGVVFGERAEYSTAIAYLNESLELAQLSGFAFPLVVSRLILATIYHALGVRSRAHAELDLAMAAAERLSIPILPGLLAALAMLQLADGDLAAAHATSKRSLEEIKFDEATASALGFSAPVPWIVDVEIKLAEGDPEHALAAADYFLAGVRRFRIRPSLSEALYVRGRVLLALGRAEEAWTVLSEARAEGAAIGCRRILWRILTTMAVEAARRGDGEAVRRITDEACHHIEHIAAHAGTDELRDSFLALPQVKTLFTLAEAHDAGFRAPGKA
jgi:tetratricopeptide (TPR) repeat protein